MIRAVSAIAVLALCGTLALAQGGARGKSELALEGGKVSVDYGRPNLRGRNLETMLPVGQEWRTGSDSPTTLTTDVGLKFGDAAVPAGTYTVSTKLVEPGTWHLILRNAEKATVAEVPLTFGKSDTSIEQFTIELTKQGNGGRMALKWGTLALATDFQKA
jgi:hypothetical protein